MRNAPDKFLEKKQNTFTFHIQCVPLATETRHLFNNSNTNEDIATKFEQEYIRCVKNKKEYVCSVCL
jgi:hypothetical protein